MTPTTSTATMSNALSSSDRTETNSSPAPVRGNFAAIPSSSSEWPTIEQANNMAIQAPPIKPVVSNKTEKASNEKKSSPELSDDNQEVFEENFASVVSKSEDVGVNNVGGMKTFVTSSPVTSDLIQASSSPWKPYRQSPQSVGACTSAVTTSVSSSVSVVSSRGTESKVTSARDSSRDDPLSYKLPPTQGNQSTQGRGQSRSNRAGENSAAITVTSQDNWEPKVLSRVLFHKISTKSGRLTLL